MAPVFGQRFRTEHLLKSGQGVDTWLAHDLETGRRVIVKAGALGKIAPGIHRRLEHEALVLRRLSSSFLVPLLHMGNEAGQLYLVTPFVDGVTLADRLRSGPLSARDTVTVGRCLLAALRDVHEHGILHGDVKPANVVVDEGSPLQRATLIDFGFSRSASPDTAFHARAGTILYMAPEQAGTIDRGVDPRSDLYSLGAVLFECLAGRPPFVADSIREVLRLHLAASPTALRHLGVDLPAVLDEVIQRLLRKDPRERYQSAESVLADLDEIAAELDRGVAEPRLVAGARDRHRSLTEPAFIGRREEIDALAAALEQARQGRGSLVLLEGTSGSGKSWLLDEIARECTRRGGWVLRGQGLDQSAQRPFQVLEGVVGDVAAAVLAEPELGTALRASIGDHAGAVVTTFPGLRTVLGVATEVPVGPEQFAEARGLPALVTLIESLGTADRPAVVLMDDCQWTDELTLKLFARWQERRDRGMTHATHVLLVVAFRSEEVGAQHMLRTLNGATSLVLAQFGAEDVRELVESMAGGVPAPVLHAVGRLAEGSPFMAAAVLRGLVECGAVVAAPSGWLLNPDALAAAQSSRRAAAFLTRRLELLPPSALALLTAGAVLGKEFDLDFAAALARQTPDDALAALAEARRRQLVWADPRGARHIFVHDKIREALLARTPPEERRTLHLLAAVRMEAANDPTPIFDLAYHFDAAGHSERALPYALAAGAAARGRHSLEIAERQYRIAERGASNDRDVQREVAEGLGDVLMLRGHYVEAAEQLVRARELCREPVASARIDGKLGELAFKRGDIATASRAIERGLGRLRCRVPRHSATMLLWLVWEVLVQALHCLLPGFFLARRSLEGADAELQAIRLYSRLAYAYWFQRGKVPCGWAHLREMNLAERYPPTPELAQAYSEHAPVVTMIPWCARGIAYAQRSLAIRRALGDLWGQGQSLHFYGVVLYAAARFEECIEKCREAVSLLERTGDRWECNTASWHIAFSLYRLGDLRGAVEASQRVYQAGLDLGDRQACGISLGAWAKASGGQLPEAPIVAELARLGEDVHTTGEVLQAKALRLLADGRPAEAVAALEEAQRRVDQAGLRQEYVAPILPWLATARRRALEQIPAWAPAARRSLTRRLGAVVRRAVRCARRYPNNLPHALRELGLYEALRGRSRHAERALARSEAVARRQGARYEEAQTLAARAHLGLLLGWPDAARCDAEASRAFPTLGADSEFTPHHTREADTTLFQATRFSTLLEAGRTIVAALSKDAVFAAVRKAAATLLRAEPCVILEVAAHEDGSTTLSPADGAPAGDYSWTVTNRALETRRTVVVADGLNDDPAESVLLAGVRSVLCAPFFVRGQPVGCLYLTNHHVAGLFGGEDEQIAEFIASLTGAALENASWVSHERRKIEARFQALIENSSDIVTVISAEGRIRYQSPSVTLLLGYEPAEMLDHSVFDYIELEDRPAVLAACTAGMTHPGTTRTAEFRFRHRDGSWRWLEAVGRATRTDDGDLVGIINSRDVTERRILTEQLRQSQRMEAVGQLAGGVAHDFNNILTIMAGHCEVLRRRAPDDPTTRRSVDTIQRAVERGAGIAAQLLAFSRKQTLEPKVLDFNAVVVETGNMLSRLIGEHVRVSHDLDPDLGFIHADPSQLEQVIMNLVLNARDAMPRGGRLTLETRRVDVKDASQEWSAELGAGSWCMLAVHDTGVGMAPDTVARVFEPFFTTKAVGKGTGLGLSTVYGIVRQSGGQIAVESTPGTGSTFRVFLPRLAGSAIDTARDHDVPAAPRGRGETLLFVEDEPEVRSLGRQALEASGYAVLEAGDGAEGLRIAESHPGPISLVVTDVVMPELNGRELVTRLRLTRPEIKVLYMSGYIDDNVLDDDALENAGLLRKPFGPSALASRVHDILS